MSGTMLPPVADEPAPKSLRGAIFAGLGLVLFITVSMFTIGRLPTIPQEWADILADFQPTEDVLNNVNRLLESKRYEDAFRAAMPLAINGNATAQFAIGVFYAEGIDAKYQRNLCAAAEWFDKAARQNHTEAQFNLAILHFTGEGVVQNDATGLYWYRTAATTSIAAVKNELAWLQKSIEVHWTDDIDLERQQSLLTAVGAQPPQLVLGTVPAVPIVGRLYGHFIANSTGCQNKADVGLHWMYHTNFRSPHSPR